MTGAASSQAAGPPTASLAVLPFIEAVYPSGRHALLSLTQVLEQAGRVRLATTDPLLWAATARLLTAVAYAAGCGPSGRQEYWHQVRHGIDLEPAVCWVGDRAADLDLFHPNRPLFQDGSLHAAASDRPDAGIEVLYLDLTAAIRRPLLSDHRHLYASTPVSSACAAGLLLVQQMWCLGGRISASDAVYGKGSNFGRRSDACGGLVIQPDGTVAQMLAWRLMPLPAPGLGTAHWTYTPRPASATAQATAGQDGLVPDGEADALTWHPRRILLLPRADGTVARTMFAQGWAAGTQAAPLITTRPGCRDLLTTAAGTRLSAEAVTSEEDAAPLLHSWWTAPEDSWAHVARRAAEAIGCQPPDVRVTGLAVIRNKKIVNTRHVLLPGSLLADARGKKAAACVMTTRHRAADTAPGFGSAYLFKEAFMHASDEERASALRGDLDLDLDLDDSLFTTADTPYRPAESESCDPVDVLTRKLGSWARSPHTRGVIAHLAAWAVEPSMTNPAYSSVTRIVPDDMHQPGMLTAALFAAHRRASRAENPYGNAPLARLMRAFGTGHHRGPRHQPTRAAMTLILGASCLGDLRPLLLQQIRFAAARRMTPDWTSLMHDLANWGPDIQERWQTQFYTSQPLPPRRQPAPSGEGHLAA
ncbi:type I-E CRISPR-associated protein Cse1/CasA [Streptomyces sp. NPDC093149]|uniref:type I-E CRISPR-associated protein Cse1/CasA n=1 Tax=Streptomyces sp. NPDC093149 TaxID=3366031 RepID=UPI0037FA3449